MTVEDILAKYSEETATLAGHLRKFILKELKNIQEIPDNAVNIIGYGYGPGYKDLICTIMLSKSGVKLGLAHSAQLPDPKKLLTGAGKLHRFIIIKDEKTIHDPAVKQLLSETLKAYQKRSS